MTAPGGERNVPRGLGLGYVVYQQILAVFGAFALAALISHLIDLEWRSFLGTLVGYWDEYVRPTVKWVLDTLIVAPLRWAFDWRVEFPLLARDYLSVGIVTALSLVRSTYRTSPKGRRDVIVLFKLVRGFGLEDVLLWPPIVPLVWPLTMPWLVYIFISTYVAPVTRLSLKVEQVRIWTILALLPALYLGVLVAVNNLLL